MKKLTVPEQYAFFKNTFSHCGCFLYELDDETLLCHLFEDFDIDAISFLHTATLDPLRENGYIDDETVSLCQLLREKYFVLHNDAIWNADEIRTSAEWRELFCLADEIRARLPENID